MTLVSMTAKILSFIAGILYLGINFIKRKILHSCGCSLRPHFKECLLCFLINLFLAGCLYLERNAPLTHDRFHEYGDCRSACEAEIITYHIEFFLQGIIHPH